jgi:SAM-dependent methyltransferase
MGMLEHVRWVWSGKSARRSLMNNHIARAVALHGRVLDIGGVGRPSYRDVLAAENCEWVVVDIAPGESVSACSDVTRLVFRNASFDAVLCLNVLEHVYDYRAALAELRRVLRPGGTLYGYVPFLCPVHPAPSDFWRFTDEALRHILAEAGFVASAIIPQGGVFQASSDLASVTLAGNRPARSLVAALALLGDAALDQVRPRLGANYPLGYFFTARAPEERHAPAVV